MIPGPFVFAWGGAESDALLPVRREGVHEGSALSACREGPEDFTFGRRPVPAGMRMGSLRNKGC